MNLVSSMRISAPGYASQLMEGIIIAALQHLPVCSPATFAQLSRPPLKVDLLFIGRPRFRGFFCVVVLMLGVEPIPCQF